MNHFENNGNSLRSLMLNQVMRKKSLKVTVMNRPCGMGVVHFFEYCNFLNLTFQEIERFELSK